MINATGQPLRNITISIQVPHWVPLAPIEPVNLAGAGHCEVMIPHTAMVAGLGTVIVVFSDASENIKIVHKLISIPKSVMEDVLNPEPWISQISKRCPFSTSFSYPDQSSMAILAGLGVHTRQISSTIAACFYPFGIINIGFSAKKLTISTLSETALRTLEASLMTAMELTSQAEGPLWFDLGARLICLQDAILYEAESTAALKQLAQIKLLLGRLKLTAHPSMDLIGTMASLLTPYDSIARMSDGEKHTLESLASELEKFFLVSSI